MSRGLSLHQNPISASTPPDKDGNLGDDEHVDCGRPGALRGAVAPGGKRKYRRHPKVNSHCCPVSLHIVELRGQDSSQNIFALRMNVHNEIISEKLIEVSLNLAGRERA